MLTGVTEAVNGDSELWVLKGNTINDLLTGLALTPDTSMWKKQVTVWGILLCALALFWWGEVGRWKGSYPKNL